MSSSDNGPDLVELKIQQKIKELYQRRFPRSKVPQLMSYSREKHVDYDVHHEKKKKEKAKGFDSRKLTQPPIHPNVRFKPLPFYEVSSDVVKASSLISRANRTYNEANLSFTLSEEQVQKICSSSTKDNLRKFDPTYQVQVQLRFCLLETTCEQKDNLPSSLCVKVNHKMAQLPSYIPPSKAGVEPRRISRPIDITSLCRLCHVSYNDVEITWSADFGRNYATCINVVTQQTSEALIQLLRRKGIRNAGHSTALVKEKLQRDPDSEIATTSLKVSLLCPLGKMRMKTPARPLTCTHLQCFDAMLFLQMNERKPTWICPVCDKPADFSNLFIDGLFMEILRETDSEEIVFCENGMWKPVEPSKETHSLCTPSKSIALDLSGSSPHSSPVRKKKSSKLKEPEIIDLTCDSSDEEPTTPSVNKKSLNGDREQEEVHSLSSISPNRPDSGGIPFGEDRLLTNKCNEQQDLTWEPTQEVPRSTGNRSNFYASALSRSSPRPGSYNPHDPALLERVLHPSLSQTPNFSISGSRDNTPPLHLGSLLPPANLAGYPNHLDYNPPSLDISSFFNHAFGDPMRRMAGDLSARSSPYLMNQPSNLYTPSTLSSNEHVARSFLTSYPAPYHPYSPSFAHPSDSSSSLDIIPID